MNEIKMCGLIFSALILCVVFKNIRQEYSLFIRLVVGILVITVSFYLIKPILSFVSEISSNTYVEAFIPSLLKALSVSFAVQITSDACYDAQENSLAEKITLFGKAEILLISLPLIKNMFELCKNLIK